MSGTAPSGVVEAARPRASKRPLVALAGNPNTGKTTLFNRLTGSSARVGNYPGVTVDRRVGRVELGAVGEVEVLDIPGTYSLVARAAEEQIAIDALLGLRGQPRPDLVVVCVDATQLLRNLYLVLQLQELGTNVVVALTMWDEAKGILPDPETLGRRLELSVAPVVGRTGEGVDALRSVMEDRLSRPDTEPRWRWTPSPGLASSLHRVGQALPEAWPQDEAVALWALLSIDDEDELLDIPDGLRRAVAACASGPGVDDEVIHARYRWLDTEVAPLLVGEPERTWTERLDGLLIHPVFGFVAFLLVMFTLFQALFAWSDPAIGAIEELFGAVGGVVAAALPAGILNDFVVNGLIGGVGSVVVFLPQILLLFFLLGLMEDSGYMARVAYLMDRVMRTMGLNGRAFVPMLSGFACAVPAIMATRTMERRRDRLLTMMVVPLMTCSARLPVYTLLIGALFPAATLMGFFPAQGLLMVGMYLFSVLTALFAAWALSKLALPASRVPLLLELPPYRMPRLIDVLRMMWGRTRMFLTEAGTVILGCTVLLWALLSFPQNPTLSKDYDALIAEAPTEQVEALEAERDGELLAASYGGRLGRAIEPAIAPLGFDWKIGVGLIGAFAAREVFVSTMGVVYGIGADVDEESATLRERMRAEVRRDGTRTYTPLVGLSLMVFFALACQCMSTLAVVKRETGGWAWPGVLFVYMTTLAWVASFVVYQGGRLLGLG
ncbi:MAG: ferrous iron transport protein B [Alphaproteobacteria bacterium]|nr:ferrous iron transport protein B [Alphaproteobacteria bacterium]MCB9796885.1 ferrous iron transport protein B [Alphaproteobacteria bacterium]